MLFSPWTRKPTGVPPAGVRLPSARSCPRTRLKVRSMQFQRWIIAASCCRAATPSGVSSPRNSSRRLLSKIMIRLERISLSMSPSSRPCVCGRSRTRPPRLAAPSPGNRNSPTRNGFDAPIAGSATARSAISPSTARSAAASWPATPRSRIPNQAMSSPCGSIRCSPRRRGKDPHRSAHRMGPVAWPGAIASHGHQRQRRRHPLL